MKYLDEYRDGATARKYSDAIKRVVTRPWTIMEVCGGQTHAIVRFGIQDLLPPEINLVHGPGCPVCVTPLEMIDKATEIARLPGVIFCSFGDMLRVPGTGSDLQSVRAAGGDVRVVYSPLDCLKIAQENPAREVVFFAVGFETTAPGNAMLVHQAARKAVTNLSVLVSHVLVPPAMEAILDSERNRVQGFLAAGHVCAVTGARAYEPLARKYKVPMVVTGFEPLDILQGICMCVLQLEQGRAEVENQYTRSVPIDGNPTALALIAEVFRVVPRHWRGIGEIPRSGLGLSEQYQSLDAERRFGSAAVVSAEEPKECMSGLVLQGVIKPAECHAFGRACTPAHPLGATMVSGEGACAAYYKYRRTLPS